MATNDGVRAVNVATIFADIGSSVSDIDCELNKYMNVYESCKNTFNKIELGKQIVDLTCCKIGFMTLIINDDEFLAIDLASLVPVTNELIDFIEDMEKIAMSIEDINLRTKAYSIVLSARVKLYDTKVFFYRFVDLSTLSGGLGGFNW